MLFEFAQWSEATGLGKMIRNSQYAFPIVEFFHLAALAIIGGAILVVDLRLLGLGSEEDVRRAAREGRAAVGDGQPDRDAAVRHRAVLVGSDEVLPEPCVLDQDDLARAGDDVHVHGETENSRGRRAGDLADREQVSRSGVVGVVVHGCVGRPLDRVWRLVTVSVRL